ncbi:LIM domain-containing protein [Laccaria bicolor S238N-H82]|uniref:LIM domain-containing protein n=1 Tax=Laccaria bicolor (strain S238N-H82 / ATCC MYA-4686) TaxID=486041 RepID=B0CUI2_LACBS|nr:LIM domain-containing protein [Laccaria bicolor S238N-H82]EDR14675.1 LIM domain-containing protein [Laccaria bicolor S238N-H82]|eukprot:XP_001875234.1 LIM domain-containing protein [Laccaria bicolor S238N-H82]
MSREFDRREQDRREQEHPRLPWSSIQNGNPLGISTDLDFSKTSSNQVTQSRNFASAPSSAINRFPDHSIPPTRASTFGTPDPDRNLSPPSPLPHSRSEDLNHSSASSSFFPPISTSTPRPSPAFLSSVNTPPTGSRPSTPATSSKSNQPFASDRSDDSNHHSSLYSAPSESSTQSTTPKAPTTVSSTSTSLVSTTCSACGKPMQGPFVRALGTVFHLNCFKCMDCGDVVASKFFPLEGPNGKQNPLCERDYFRRLNLICAKCGMALRGSYITACNKKFHVEHFTCSLCPTLFGPQDSYYEHDGDVFCHFHYSTRFATKCAGCSSAILKQFVEINRNSRDECWHPECYMINKFWNVKVVSRRPTSSASVEGGEPEEPAYVEEEQRETPQTLKDKQVRMEQQVYRIWTVLSAFEESSAACISDMLRQVSNGQYLDAIRMAEKFILHVEVLFATIDDLEFHFALLSMKGMSHVREARMLCRKTVELFTLLSHTQETGARRMGMTQELLALVTGLAHYLKILIRIALTGALKLEREHSAREAMSSFLDKLHLLAVQGGNPSAKRLIKSSNGEILAPAAGANFGTQSVTYGFRSLAPENAGESPFSAAPPSNKTSTSPPSDLCVKCSLTVEEDCVRLGTYQRWHSNCVQCAQCGKVATVPLPKELMQLSSKSGDEKEGKDKDQPPKLSSARRPPANVGLFVYDPEHLKETTSFGDVPTVILCTDHAHPGCRSGFQAVQRLEQYAFLLNVALRRLYLLLKKQGVVPLSPGETTSVSSPQTLTNSDPYRNSGDIMRMKSVHLDRKLSATARLPKRSTIVESPAGRSAHPSDGLQPQRPHEVGTPAPHQSSSSIPQSQHAQQGQMSYQGQGNQSSRQSPPTQPPRSYYSNGPPEPSDQVIRPSLSRGHTEVRIVDESAPNSPAGEEQHQQRGNRLDDGITLADIPQLMEVAQAREQQRSLPRENSIPYIAELSALELAIVKHSAVLALTRSPLKDQFDLEELLEMVEVKKSGFWNKLFKGDKKSVKKKGVFGVPLELLVEREGADSLLGATRATLRVPSFIDDVISAMRQMDMSIEGIFRKNGNIRRLRDLTDAIDRDPASVDLSQDNPVQLAALLKKFLRDLPDPLMTFKLHRLFIASQSLPQDEDRKRYLHLISLIMPKSHRDTMEVLFVFLKWVASFAHLDAETGSKMDLGNLATVICPSILYARGRDAMRDETFGALRVMTSLLENQDEFFTVPEEFLPILHDQEYFASSLELPSKEFMKKCDTYMRIKGSNGRSTPGAFNSSSNSNGTAPRYPPPSSSVMERPPLAGPSGSERTLRPSPGMSQSTEFHPPSSSPSLPQGVMQNLQQRSQMDWSGPPPPRPVNPNGPSSRPSSFVGPPPPRSTALDSVNQSQHSYNSTPPNGYSSAVRQRS